MSNACPMIIRCHRYQNPADYGRASIDEPHVAEAYSHDPPPPSTPAIVEEPMGNGATHDDPPVTTEGG